MRVGHDSENPDSTIGVLCRDITNQWLLLVVARSIHWRWRIQEGCGGCLRALAPAMANTTPGIVMNCTVLTPGGFQRKSLS